jgi:hypothetical protein
MACGCSVTNNFDEITRLQSYSNNKDRQESGVKAQDQKFEKILAVAKGSGFSQYPDRRSILKNFGKPVFSRWVTKDEIQSEVWLYRHTTQYFGVDKVYIYFDDRGKLQRWDYTPGGTPTTANPAAHPLQ